MTKIKYFLEDNLFDFVYHIDYFLDIKINPYFVIIENKFRNNDVIHLKRYSDIVNFKISVHGVDYDIKEFVNNKFEVSDGFFILYFQEKLKKFCEDNF